jgi:dynein heavy chain 1
MGTDSFSSDIALTLDILKHAKRFHATVSFIADTGLKEGMELGKKLLDTTRCTCINNFLTLTSTQV